MEPITPTPAPTKSFLSRLLGDMNVNTSVGFSQGSLLQAGAAIFITAVLIILAYFTFKKFVK